MGVRFAKRTASRIMGRGMNAIRIKGASLQEAEKALTAEDIRKLVKNGGIYALPEKHNLSMNSKVLKRKRDEGRRRGPGRRKGTSNARKGIGWEKKVRSQRLFLRKLRDMKRVDSKTFRKFYRHIKGASYEDKATLLLHLREEGANISDDDLKQVSEYARSRYNK